MKVKITVTKQHIREGSPSCPTTCPIANAFRQVTLGVAGVRTVDIRLESNKKVKLPRKVVAFIRAFDSRKPVKPFSFTIDLPKKYVAA